jgi:hypothetical protein
MTAELSVLSSAFPALIAWAERAASRRRSVKPAAANGGGPQGQALQTVDGEQTIESAIGQCGGNATGGACGASPSGKMFASLSASSKRLTLILIDATAMRIAAPRTVPRPSTSRKFSGSFGRCSPPRRGAPGRGLGVAYLRDMSLD